MDLEWAVREWLKRFQRNPPPNWYLSKKHIDLRMARTWICVVLSVVSSNYVRRKTTRVVELGYIALYQIHHRCFRILWEFSWHFYCSRKIYINMSVSGDCPWPLWAVSGRVPRVSIRRKVRHTCPKTFERNLRKYTSKNDDLTDNRIIKRKH